MTSENLFKQYTPSSLAVMLSCFITLSFSSSLFAANIQFSPEEAEYIDQKKTITMCVDPDWLPYERISKAGNHIGIAADYMAIFSKLINVPITLVTTTSWSESEAFAEQRKCDILSMLNESPKRKKYLNFTTPYLETSVVLVSREEEKYIDGLNSLAGKTLAIVKGYVYEDLIKKDYPAIKIVNVKSNDEGFKLVSEGKIFASMGSLYIVTTKIQALGLVNLKAAGPTEYTNKFRVGIRNDDPMLLSIFQKAIDNLDPIEENEILQQWFTVKVELGYDYILFWKVLAGTLFIVGLLLIWNRQLSGARKKADLAYQKLNILQKKLEEKIQELEIVSITDPLTGLNNRLKIDLSLDDELTRSSRSKQSFGLIIIDVDYFKKVNDNFGHKVGDNTLKHLAQILNDEVRKTDITGRWGGEEFLIICPNTDAKGVVKFSEDIRKKIESAEFIDIGQQTASFGVTISTPEDTISSIFIRVDKALYKAKNNGRNRTESIFEFEN